MLIAELWAANGCLQSKLAGDESKEQKSYVDVNNKVNETNSLYHWQRFELVHWNFLKSKRLRVNLYSYYIGLFSRYIILLLLFQLAKSFYGAYNMFAKDI